MCPECRKNYDKIYGFQSQPAENFIAQIAFTQLNSFVLTTDGRVFSWGGVTYCLGRMVENESDRSIDEIENNFTSPIVKIATGRSHVLALDARGNVLSWGNNDQGQLGHGDAAGEGN